MTGRFGFLVVVVAAAVMMCGVTRSSHRTARLLGCEAAPTASARTSLPSYYRYCVSCHVPARLGRDVAHHVQRRRIHGRDPSAEKSSRNAPMVCRSQHRRVQQRRRLSQADIDTIAAKGWVDGGTREGNARGDAAAASLLKDMLRSASRTLCSRCRWTSTSPPKARWKYPELQFPRISSGHVWVERGGGATGDHSRSSHFDFSVIEPPGYSKRPDHG